MKTKFLLPLFGAIILFGCAEFGAFEEKGLDAKTEKGVLKDCVKYLNKQGKTLGYNTGNTLINIYYGTYKGSIVVSVTGKKRNANYHQRATIYCVAGIRIGEGSGAKHMLVWRADKVYHITEAWDSELLTKADVQSIAESQWGLDNDFMWCSGCRDCK